MRINFVTEPPPGWVLRRLTANWRKYLPGSTTSLLADPTAAINYYVDYGLYHYPSSRDVGFFTHRDFNSRWSEVFDSAARQIDWCVSMCEQTSKFLPPAKTTIIPIAPDRQFARGPLVIGVVGTEKDTGRKRFAWLKELAKIPGLVFQVTAGRVPWDKMPAFYRGIDYLLILSDNEGGPLPLLESLSMGKPVIGSDVGLVSKYTTLRYETFEDLVKLLRGLVIPADLEQQSVLALAKVLEHVHRVVPSKYPEVAPRKIEVPHFRQGTDDDRFIIDELIDRDMYRMQFLSSLLPARGILYDCGAHIGVFSLLFNIHFPDYKIRAFEPASANFSILTKNLVGSNFECNNLGVGTERESLKLYAQGTSDRNGNFSLTPESVEGTFEEIEIVNLFEMLEAETDNFVAIKLDLEGYEAKIIEAMPDECVKRIDILFLEEHHIPIDHQKLIRNGLTLLFNPLDSERHFVYVMNPEALERLSYQNVSSES